ncbi:MULTISPECIES: crossover junction endodeoxyribonuclease RuvC [unclassified Leptolyngbya]|uniref:crossover junction endodeoxyribonuclease RuvC n=1 Tax=unclassified Leptolyngbya TaxID=2650499 RepID=UPI001686D753|nr:MULTISPECIES: crossover junction endodeoxyribonuclease RuvC [unclassified Leptolyngbya]MBD1909183.1 crossover junction endodeoxyribonuclease RuvC [Leptolyngbya sp. FACHB-8]MBD2158436.1 crossover junction endodeoxyribonuclease RuvC [Leptolyngbya sp. FACHB-16]
MKTIPSDLSTSVILGIDPAIASIGFGVIRGEQAIDYGVITTPASSSMYDRLCQIRTDVQELCTIFQPEVAAIEMPFFGRENTNASKVLRALGVIELALGDYGLIDLIFLHQSQVKSSVAQYGASKADIKSAVMHIFNLPAPPSPDDSADGLAIAYAAQCGLRANVK